jgi:hypothetical protein
MKSGSLGLAAACALLALSVLIVFPIVGYFAYAEFGTAGLEAAGVAASVCWIAATAALMLTGMIGKSPSAVSGILVAGALRFALPLLVGSGLQFVGGTLAESGVFGWIVVFYLLTLTVETTLSVLVHRDQTKDTARVL